MSKKDLFARAEAYRTGRLAETARIQQEERNRKGSGIIKRGNDARKKAGIVGTTVKERDALRSK